MKHRETPGFPRKFALPAKLANRFSTAGEALASTSEHSERTERAATHPHPGADSNAAEDAPALSAILKAAGASSCHLKCKEYPVTLAIFCSALATTVIGNMLAVRFIAQRQPLVPELAND